MRISARVRFFLACLLALAGVRAASAQCYQFTATPDIYTYGGTGGPANVTLNFTNLPAPTISGVPGSNSVSYTWLVNPSIIGPPLPGASATVIDAGISYPSYLAELYIHIGSSPPTTIFQAYIYSSSIAGQSAVGQILTLTGQGNLLPNLLPNDLPAVLPPVSAWKVPTGAYFASGLPGAVPGSNSDTGFTAITSCAPAKTLGDCGCGSNVPGSVPAGDPINVDTGNLFEAVDDYETLGRNKLGFTRYYNSLGSSTTFATSIGTNWRSNYDRYLRIVSASSVTAERADGQQLNFTSSGGAWATDSDVDLTLANSGSTWILTDKNDTVETYTAGASGEALLTTIAVRNGYRQTLQYNGSNQLVSVSDSYGRSLSLAYLNGLLQTVTTPDGLILTYGYSSSGVAPGVLDRLASVAYSTTPQTSQSYLYENSSLPFALTGITDEDGNRYTTWTYDSSGRALTSQHAGGADLTTIVYNDTDGSRMVTDALGQQSLYKFTTLQGVPKVTEIDRQAISTITAATQTFTYDSNGYTASKTDWNGNQTAFVNDTHGDPTTINEAVGTSAARTTTIVYDSTWVHLPDSVTSTGLTSSFTYDGSGEQLTKTLTDTMTTTAPYSSKGQTRTWTNTWANHLLASAQTPNGNTTKYGYDSTGALTSITDPINHVTQITAHTGGGLPETVVDPNGVTTTLTYDARLRLTSRTVSGTSGTYKTTWAFDAAGNLITTTLPDGSYLTNAYDTAHRLTQVTDALGNYTSYTLDAQGDRTQTNIYKSGGTLTWQESGTFDALGRELVDTAGAGQTTTRTYDPNSNVLTVVDGLSHTTTKTYDALNRVSTSTDANACVTTLAYDTLDRIVAVTDANNNSTAYVRDGFGDVIQQTSQDSGVSVFHYDGDANLTSKTDALGIVTNQSFDGLDRPLTTAYPADTAENVVYTYDQSGTGFAFGIGRLTSVTDAAGSLTRTYEERGNLAAEQRINGSTTLTTGYTYDGASRVASMSYPDGTFVTYQYNAAGYLATVSAKPAGSSTTTTIATLNHQPFGPINAATYGNGTAETWAFDSSYRPTNITDALAGGKLQNLSYAYDNANNVTSITDALNAANSQTLSYDTINRLTSAASGTGGYGGYGWTYDKVGNRLTQVQGSATTTYGYTPGTNRLATITPGTTTALLLTPKMMKRRSGPGPVLSAQNQPSATPAAGAPTNGPIQPSTPGRRSSNTIANILGWPMVLVGFAGVLRFRTRLLSDRVLATIVLAMLTGGATILIGCAGGSNAGSNPPTPTVTAPTFSPAAGTYTSAQTVTISDATAGATINYTTDGSTPTTNSTKYTGAITVSTSETIQAIAVASGYTNSAVGTASYIINIALPTAATPTFSPVAGTYTAAQSVTISDSTAGAAIYYTTNGTAPSASSTQYTAAIGVSNSETIEAIAVASGYANSAIATAAYTINLPTVVTVTTNANGNITSIPPANSAAYATFAYNNANRLVSVTGSPLGATFVYDWAGQRFSKTNNGSTPMIYSYAQGGTLIAENNGGAVTDYIYADGRPIAILQPSVTPAANQVSYVVADHLGTPQLVSNSSGATVWSTVYQPFGTTGINSGSISQYLRFPGQIADTETGFSYNLNRDYMPNLGRYLESDPIGLVGGINGYGYSDQNPLHFTDPSGRVAIIDNAVGGIFALGFDLAAQRTEAYFRGQAFCWNWKRSAIAFGAGFATSGVSALADATFIGNALWGRVISNALVGTIGSVGQTAALNYFDRQNNGYIGPAIFGGAFGGLGSLATDVVSGIGSTSGISALIKEGYSVGEANLFTGMITMSGYQATRLSPWAVGGGTVLGNSVGNLSAFTDVTNKDQ